MAFTSRIGFLLTRAVVLAAAPTPSFSHRVVGRALLPSAACWRQCSASVEEGTTSAIPEKQYQRTNTKISVDFESHYAKLCERLKNNRFVKATDVNILCYNAKSLEQLGKVKEVLKLFRLSPSFSRNSQASVFVTTCTRLDVPEQALEVISNPVEYGLFCGRRALRSLLFVFAMKRDLEGFDKSLMLMKEAELEMGGYELKLKVTMHMDNFCVRYKQSSDDTLPTLEDLDPILEMCQNCYMTSVDRGNLAYYFVNGRLLADDKLFPLSGQMVDKMDKEKKAGLKLRLNLRLDYALRTEDFAGVVAALTQMKEANLLLSHKRLPRLQSVFKDDCKDPQIVESFKDLKLEEMTNSPPSGRESIANITEV